MDSPNAWIQLVGVILAGGVGTAIVQAIATHKKVDSESDDTFVTTSNKQRQSLVDDADRYKRERDEEHARANRNDWKLREWWARADRMMIWVRRQVARNEAAGIDDPPPELYPAPGE